MSVLTLLISFLCSFATFCDTNSLPLIFVNKMTFHAWSMTSSFSALQRKTNDNSVNMLKKVLFSETYETRKLMLLNVL